MLASSFIHAPGVGQSTERALWRRGVTNWDAFLVLHQAGQLRGGRMDRLAKIVEESRRALDREDVAFFDRRLPGGELWRLYTHFVSSAAYFDIETTGLSPASNVITVIGLYDGTHFEAFVRGQNLHDFPKAAARHPLLVSYNGATFDVPFLQTAFPGFEPRAHLDLRYPLARLGYRGGLKEIEHAVGIRRPGHVAELSGFDAVMLWHRHVRGDAAALRTLLDYTREDVVNLAQLAARVAREMPARVGFTASAHPRGSARGPRLPPSTSNPRTRA